MNLLRAFIGTSHGSGLVRLAALKHQCNIVKGFDLKQWYCKSTVSHMKKNPSCPRV